MHAKIKYFYSALVTLLTTYSEIKAIQSGKSSTEFVFYLNSVSISQSQ